MVKYFSVDADHVAAKYAAKGKRIKASHDEFFGWHADASPYGVGKSFQTAKQAVRDLLESNGCSNIRMTETD